MNNSTEGTKVKADEILRCQDKGAKPRRREPSEGSLLAEMPSQTLVEEIPSQVSIEVRSLSGESVLCAEFALADQALSLKKRLQAIRKIPVWQQMLTFQGEMVHNHSKLEELQLPSEGTVFELVIRARPSDEDIQTLSSSKRLLEEATSALESLRKCDFQEVRCLRNPPAGCETVCLAAMCLLAGSWDAIQVKRSGSPKDTTWAGCQQMLANSQLKQQLMSLHCHIDHGELSKGCMDACRRQIRDILPEADSDSDKIREMGRRSLMCQRLLQHLLCVREYYDSVAELSEHFGGATITQLMVNC